MKIIVDTREQKPFTFEGREAVEVVVGTLATGDYSLVGLEDRVALERKSLADLVGCLTGSNRDRFERELARGRGLDYFAVIIENGFEELTAKQYHSNLNPHAAAQSILAFQVRHRVPFIWAGNRRAAEYSCYWLLSKYLREAEARYKAIIKAHGQEVAL
ncbi:MAG: ERCC4 domain-containing protein [Candidatus Adiutrix sp.]|jgi:ERCC4-type nuclease|nr:ERCC4 domain-containing protein [Candidatus Adiutrix sp.]